jgi:hypothetical protein
LFLMMRELTKARCADLQTCENLSSTEKGIAQTAQALQPFRSAKQRSQTEDYR